MLKPPQKGVEAVAVSVHSTYLTSKGSHAPRNVEGRDDAQVSEQMIRQARRSRTELEDILL